MKAANLVAYVTKAKSEGWGYVLGGQGEIYSPALARKWAAARQGGKGTAYFLNDCSRWFGRKVVDCSGLIIEALRSLQPRYEDQTADTLYSRCRTGGMMSSLPEQPGLCVWKKGHIGVYIGGGQVIEAKGYKYGVVQTALKSGRWTNWGRLRDVDYSPSSDAQTAGDSQITCDAQGVGLAVSGTIIYRQLRLKKPMMRGEDVRWLQAELTARGFDAGGVDGIFGSKTGAAVRAFQRAKNLLVDGIAGVNTITALGGVYR